jgi:hypothetical protein
MQVLAVLVVAEAAVDLVATMAAAATEYLEDYMVAVAVAVLDVMLLDLLVELEPMALFVLSGPETHVPSHQQIQVIYNGSIIS